MFMTWGVGVDEILVSLVITTWVEDEEGWAVSQGRVWEVFEELCWVWLWLDDPEVNARLEVD